MTFATELFRIVTDADAERVWNALTPAKKGSTYVYGMVVASDWTAGAPISLGPDTGPRLTGVVLVADRPGRLTYTLGDTAEQPSFYVTWEICPGQAGTVVRLFVDDLDPEPDTTTDLESVWLPVLSELRLRLDRDAAIGRASTLGD
jgi:uncharacterized protein YndB with AHSA1/START domain